MDEQNLCPGSCLQTWKLAVPGESFDQTAESPLFAETLGEVGEGGDQGWRKGLWWMAVTWMFQDWNGKRVLASKG